MQQNSGWRASNVAMKSDMKKPFAARWFLWFAGLMVCATAWQSASAVLGGSVTTVLDDQVHMRGSMRVTTAAKYTVHEIKAPSDTVVREFVSPAGTVFGVAWSGPATPDLRTVLGS